MHGANISDNANISNVDKYMLSTVFNDMMCSISNIGVHLKCCCDAEEKHFHGHDWGLDTVFVPLEIISQLKRERMGISCHFLESAFNQIPTEPSPSDPLTFTTWSYFLIKSDRLLENFSVWSIQFDNFCLVKNSTAVSACFSISALTPYYAFPFAFALLSGWTLDSHQAPQFQFVFNLGSSQPAGENCRNGKGQPWNNFAVRPLFFLNWKLFFYFLNWQQHIFLFHMLIVNIRLAGNKMIWIWKPMSMARRSIQIDVRIPMGF